ncbi:NACHT domain-containing protein [Nostoc sp. 106C]|uniref:NACHT domain-containing protein n=1 Tax=Nostoc sp. 106C TaxID=1932667 RepID=UPI000A39F142|nr:NACHT domain-containing protein [Nostoc sp. 106C]OUL25539.1 hypothetical protein BV375_22425 [Nostoc sp. 106C]
MNIKSNQNNPFYFGGAVSPDKFMGRRSDINAAFDVIYNRMYLAIQGSSGMGKSSLLRYIAAPETWKTKNLDTSQVFIIFFNCSEILPSFTAIGFWEKVLSSLKKQVEDNEALQLAIEQILAQGTYSVNELRYMLAEIGKANKFLLLLLDNFDVALYPNAIYTEDDMRSFLSNLRNLASHGQEKDYLCVILTSLKRLSEMGPEITPGTSPWNNHYTYRYLKPLKQQEVSNWLQNVSAQYSLPWLIDLQAGIQEISGGNPALLQSAGFLLYRAWRDGDIATVVDFAREFEKVNRQYFSIAWKLSTDDEKSILKFLALSRLEGRLNHKRKYTLDGVDIILSQKDRQLRELEERGIIRCYLDIDDSEQGDYVFTSSIMEWWVIKELENSQNQPDLAERELVFLNLSSKQIEQMKSIMKQVWQYKDTIQSVAGWMGKLGGAFVKGVIGQSPA